MCKRGRSTVRSASRRHVPGVLSKCIDHMDAASHYCDIIVFAIAGSPACEHHLDALQERLAPHGKELSIYYANAKFNLADNGTDLGFTGAEYDEASKKLIDEAVGDFAASMKCAVWDWVRVWDVLVWQAGEPCHLTRVAWFAIPPGRPLQGAGEPLA